MIGISMGTYCAPLLADLFLYSYEVEFLQSLLSTGRKRLASQFNFTYRYIDDVLSINNPDFESYLGQMYPPWTWDQRHDGEQHFCFLLGFTPLFGNRDISMYLEIEISLFSLNCIYSIKFKYCDKNIQIWDLEKSKHAYINPSPEINAV